MLALLGEARTEQLSKAAAQTRFKEKGVPPKDARAMVSIASDSKPDQVPDDARTLRKWLATGSEVLPRCVSDATEKSGVERRPR